MKLALALALLLPALPCALAAPPAAGAAPLPAPAVTNGAPARLEINVHKGINKNKASSVSTQESYQFTVKVRNNEPKKAFTGLTAELFVLGVDKSDETMFNLISRTTEVFDLGIRAEHAFESKLFYVKYTTNSGSELGGYLVVITDAEGRVVAMKSTRSSLEKNLERIRGAPVSTSKKKAFRLE